MLPEYFPSIIQIVAAKTGTEISSAGAYLFLKLISKCEQDNKYYIEELGIKKLAVEFDISINTFKKGIKELIACGVMREKRSDDQKIAASYYWQSPSPPPSTLEKQEPTERNVDELKDIIETLIYCSEEYITAEKLSYLSGTKLEKTLEIVEALRKEYDNRAIEIVEHASGFRMNTRSVYSDYAEKVRKKEDAPKLTDSELEVLSIIFYKAPISRVDIGKVRGKMPLSSLDNLIRYKFVREIEKNGAISDFEPTPEALSYFGLKDLSELPPLPVPMATSLFRNL